MPRLVVAALGLSAALFASPALAEPPYPTVDFQGDWVLTDGKGTEVRAEMHYTADGRKMRIDMNQQGMAMSSVRDIDGDEMIMWSDQMPGMGMRIDTAGTKGIEGEPTDETRTINGEACTVWQMAKAKACLTEDNIPVEVSGEGFTSGLENLQRTAQDPAMFAVPEGLNIIDMPVNMQGNGPKPGQGLPF